MKLLSLAAATLVSSAALGAAPPAPDQAIETVVLGRNGETIGSLRVVPLRPGVRLVLEVSGLQPGTHALHLHETGRCDPPDFTTAGDHFDPAGAAHGLPDADGDFDDQDHHAGDMPNQTVRPDGTLQMDVTNASVTLREDNALLDGDGTALVLHANADDYSSQPSGAAGERVACAVISAPGGDQPAGAGTST
jgi:superoxide dismutase, Cu-Zn family